MAVDEADRLGRKASIGERHVHGDGHGVHAGLGDVAAVGVGGEAHDLAMDACTTCQCMLAFLEDQGPRPLADHQAVAVAVEGARRRLGPVVSRRCREQRVEDRRHGNVEFLGAACDHNVRLAAADRLVGIADTLAAGRAGARCRDDPSRQAEEQPDVHCCGVAHHLDVAGGGERSRAAVGDELIEASDGGGRTERGAVGHADGARLQQRVAEQAGIGKHPLSGVDRHQRDRPHRARLLARIAIGGDAIDDGRRQSRVQPVVAIPLGHVADGRASGLEIRADRRPVVTERRDAAHAGDDHAAGHIMPPFTEMTWRVT